MIATRTVPHSPCPTRRAGPPSFGVYRKRPRQGFTLLEVLIASALTAVLLAALWSMLKIYSGLYETGQAKTQHAQLARSLQKQLADDLMSACLGSTGKPHAGRREPMPNTPSVDLPSPDRTSDGPSPSDAASQVDRPADSGPDMDLDLDARATPSSPSRRVTGFTIDSASFDGGPTASVSRVGLVGTPTSLVLDVVVPVDPYLFVGEESDDSSETPRVTLSRAPELQRVTYTFSGPNPLVAGSSSSSSGLVRRQSTWEQAYAATPQSDMPGSSELLADVPADNADFVRWDTVENELVDDFPSALPDENQTSRTQSEPIVDRIPEVINFQLRYFDGVVWLAQWNSRHENSLPVAVEVQFDLQPQSKPGLQAVPSDETLVADTDTSLEPDGSDLSDGDLGPDAEEVQWPDEADGLLDVEQLPLHRVVFYLERNDGPRQQQATGRSMSEFQRGSSP